MTQNVNTSTALICTALLVIVSQAAAGADKITTDPNAGTVAEAPTPVVTDARLDQKVTHQKGYARLHTICEELTRQTGVTIYAGSSRKDWQVRDVPMVVCVKDVPLGTLLRAIADASHCTMRSVKIEDENKIIYRILRPKAQQDAIADSVEAERKAGLATLQWEWDSLVKIAGTSEADIDDAVRPEAKNELVARARLIAALGPEAEARVMAGDAVMVDGHDVPQLTTWMRANYGKLQGDARNQEIVSSLLAQGHLDASASTSLALYVSVPEYGQRPLISVKTQSSVANSTWIQSSQISGSLWEIKDPSRLSLPPRPQPPRTSIPADEAPGADCQRLGPEGNSRMPALVAKVKPEAPDSGDTVTFADRLLAVCKAGGVNLVCEDFGSHLDSSYGPAGAFYGKDTSVISQVTGESRMRWFCSDKDNLVLGWARDWRSAHYNLVPESYLLDLTKRLRGEGLDLDDVLSLQSLTQQQRLIWITNSHDLKRLGSVQPGEEGTPLWELYASLSRDDKAQAMSETGFPLAKLDPAWVVSFFRASQRKLIGSGILSPSFGNPFPMFQQELLDTEHVGDYSIRVVRDELQQPASATNAHAVQRSRYTYRLILGKQSEAKPVKSFTLPTEFPIVEKGTPRR